MWSPVAADTGPACAHSPAKSTDGLPAVRIRTRCRETVDPDVPGILATIRGWEPGATPSPHVLHGWLIHPDERVALLAVRRFREALHWPWRDGATLMSVADRDLAAPPPATLAPVVVRRAVEQALAAGEVWTPLLNEIATASEWRFTGLSAGHYVVRSETRLDGARGLAMLDEPWMFLDRVRAMAAAWDVSAVGMEAALPGTDGIALPGLILWASRLVREVVAGELAGLTPDLARALLDTLPVGRLGVLLRNRRLPRRTWYAIADWAVDRAALDAERGREFNQKRRETLQAAAKSHWGLSHRAEAALLAEVEVASGRAPTPEELAAYGAVWAAGAFAGARPVWPATAAWAVKVAEGGTMPVRPKAAFLAAETLLRDQTLGHAALRRLSAALEQMAWRARGEPDDESAHQMSALAAELLSQPWTPPDVYQHWATHPSLGALVWRRVIGDGTRYRPTRRFIQWAAASPDVPLTHLAGLLGRGQASPAAWRSAAARVAPVVAQPDAVGSDARDVARVLSFQPRARRDPAIRPVLVASPEPTTLLQLLEDGVADEWLPLVGRLLRHVAPALAAHPADVPLPVPTAPKPKGVAVAVHLASAVLHDLADVVARQGMPAGVDPHISYFQPLLRVGTPERRLQILALMGAVDLDRASAPWTAA